MKNISPRQPGRNIYYIAGLTAKGQDAISKIQPINTAVRVNRGDININALRHFVRNFNDTSSEKWFATRNLVVALFSFHDIDYRVDYNSRNGNWIETFRTYGEAKMSPDLKQSVQSSYYDYTIFQVPGIEQPLHPVNYIVHLSGKAKLDQPKGLQWTSRRGNRILRNLTST
jgi:hypothetical protein